METKYCKREPSGFNFISSFLNGKKQIQPKRREEVAMEFKK